MRLTNMKFKAALSTLWMKSDVWNGSILTKVQFFSLLLRYSIRIKSRMYLESKLIVHETK